MELFAAADAPEIISWLGIAERYGLPLVALVIVVWGGAKISRYLSARILEPLADRHIKFLDQTEKCLTQQSETLESLSNSLDRIAEKQREHLEVCRTGIRPALHG